MKKWIKRIYLSLRYSTYVKLHGGYSKVANTRKFKSIQKEYREFLTENF